jgi:GMP synthase-like glutamine amidotransferase
MPKAPRPLRIAIVEHHDHENAATIFHRWAKERDYPVPVVFNVGENRHALPDHRNFDLIVYMGGTPNLDEIKRHPWIQKEQKLIQAAAKAGKLQLGICFGSQNMAAAFGGGVHKRKEPLREWSLVRLTRKGKKSLVFPKTPDSLMMMLNHEYGIKTPKDARTTLWCKHMPMGFELHDGRTVGILPHPEPDTERVKLAQKNAAPLIEQGRIDSETFQRLVDGVCEHGPIANQYVLKLLDNMVRKHAANQGSNPTQ